MLANLLTNYLLAYMDPASGSLIAQVVLGGIAGAVVALKLFWGRITSFFNGSPPESSARGERVKGE